MPLTLLEQAENCSLHLSVGVNHNTFPLKRHASFIVLHALQKYEDF